MPLPRAHPETRGAAAPPSTGQGELQLEAKSRGLLGAEEALKGPSCGGEPGELPPGLVPTWLFVCRASPAWHQLAARSGTARPAPGACGGTAQCPKCSVLAKRCLGGSCCCRAAALVPGGVCRQSSVPRGTRCFPGSAALLAALVSRGCPHAPRAPAASGHTVPECLWTHRKPQRVDFTT